MHGIIDSFFESNDDKNCAKEMIRTSKQSGFYSPSSTNNSHQMPLLVKKNYSTIWLSNLKKMTGYEKELTELVMNMLLPTWKQSWTMI